MLTRRPAVPFLIALTLTATSTAYAAVTRVEVTKRQDIAGSPYEKLAGTVYFDKGSSSAMSVLRPKDAANGNGAALIELSGRGRRSALRLFNRGGPNPDPDTSADLGDGFLMRFGFTLAWIDDGDDGRRFVAVRDFATWIKHARDAAVTARYVYAFGSVESGQFLRDFLAGGFNTDEQQRDVFDGVWAHSMGATACAAPGARRQDAVKIFCTTTSADYWSGRVGREDVAPPENVRIYFFAGTQPAPARFPPTQDAGQQIDNAVDYWWAMRALLLAMHRWVSAGRTPPASAYPARADRTLVETRAIAFPAIPGVTSPLTLTGRPPTSPLVPALDEDGNEAAGIRLPDVAVPLATYTGWNFRHPSTGSPGELVPLLGSSIFFPSTRTARATINDPRRSIEERYTSRDAYLAKVREAAESLAARGYLLFDDVDRILQRADDTWAVAAARK